MKKFLVIALGFLLIPQAKAQPAVLILRYQFQIMTSPGVSVGTSAPDYVNSLVLTSASNMNYGPGLLGSTGYTAGVNALPDRAQWADNWNTVFDATDYYTWTETPVTGFLLVHDSITFYTRRSGTGPTTLQMRSSANGYSAAFWAGTGGGTDTWKKHKITLGIPSTVSPITFRLYSYGSTGSAGTLRIDSVKVYAHLFNVFNLPVELLSFDGKARENAVDLYWSTATEANNDYFTVLRSKDGINFEEVGRVPGAGNTQTEADYTLVDAWPTPGINYYMLTQTDFDGTTTQHNVIAINFGRARGDPRVFNALGQELDDTSHIRNTGMYILKDEYGNTRKFYTLPP